MYDKEWMDLMEESETEEEENLFEEPVMEAGESVRARSAIEAEESVDEGTPDTFEDALDDLEEILGRMEDREATLEETFALYRRGLARLQFARERLDAVEKQVLQLEQDGGLTRFDEE